MPSVPTAIPRRRLLALCDTIDLILSVYRGWCQQPDHDIDNTPTRRSALTVMLNSVVEGAQRLLPLIARNFEVHAALVNVQESTEALAAEPLGDRALEDLDELVRAGSVLKRSVNSVPSDPLLEALRYGPEIDDIHLPMMNGVAAPTLPPQPSTRQSSPTSSARGLEFVEGGFRYNGGTVVPLKGKPLAVLKAIDHARGKRKSCNDLIHELWPDCPPEEGTVRSHICKARQALRVALKQAGLHDADNPLPHVDKGRDLLAWSLNLP